MENGLEIPQKIKNSITLWPNNLTSGYISKITKSRILKIYLHIHAHCITIHNSQEIEENKMSIDSGMGKENVTWHRYRKIDR